MAVRAVCAGAARWREMLPDERQPWAILANAESCRYRQLKAEKARQNMLLYVSNAAENDMLK